MKKDERDEKKKAEKETPKAELKKRLSQVHIITVSGIILYMCIIIIIDFSKTLDF